MLPNMVAFRRSKFIFITLIVSTFAWIWLLCFWEGSWKYIVNLNIEAGNTPPISPHKLILLWSTIYGENNLKAWGVDKLEFNNCPKKCLFSMDKSLFTSSHAVVYHGFPEGENIITGKQYLYPLPSPKKRDPNQIWIYFTIEPPSPHLDEYESLNDHFDFNWTMTYRTDSDIWYPYGIYEERKDTLSTYEYPRKNSNTDTGRALAVALISECSRPSGRDDYIHELLKVLPIDIYGKCGNFTCPKTVDCYNKLALLYKFWLSFENSICTDYVTEKVFSALKNGILPVYYGHNSIKRIKGIPESSYINTNDFDSPSTLGKYLLYLDQNPKEYNKYFDFNKKYQLVPNPSERAWCEVCQKLYNLKPSTSKSYKSVRDWLLRNYTSFSVCDTRPGKT